MLIERESKLTGKIHTMEIPITPQEFSLLGERNRPNIQDLFPNLSADEREFLLTGITPEEWESVFK